MAQVLRKLVDQAERRKSARAAQRSLVPNAPSTNAMLTTALAKSHLRVDDTDDDTIIDTFVKAATRAAEQYCRRSFLNATWNLWLDEGAFDDDSITLSMGKLSSVTSITTYDDAGSGTVFSSSNYYADANSEPGRVHLVEGNVWPSDIRERASMDIEFVAGWGAAVANIPAEYTEALTRAIMLTVSALYENRGDQIMKTGLTQASMALLAPYRLLRVGRRP